jgi:hypothetical protein
MRQSHARFSGGDTSCRMPWSAGYITNMFESEFSTHTAIRRASSIVSCFAAMASFSIERAYCDGIFTHATMRPLDVSNSAQSPPGNGRSFGSRPAATVDDQTSFVGAR